jgi:hypothetical protein
MSTDGTAVTLLNWSIQTLLTPSNVYLYITPLEVLYQMSPTVGPAGGVSELVVLMPPPVTVPPIFTFPPTAAPPVTTSAPVVVLLLDAVLVMVNVLVVPVPAKLLLLLLAEDVVNSLVAGL